MCIIYYVKTDYDFINSFTIYVLYVLCFKKNWQNGVEECGGGGECVESDQDYEEIMEDTKDECGQFGRYREITLS